MDATKVTTGIPFTEAAMKILTTRYLTRTPEGKILETPEQMFQRIAKALAQVERTYYNKSEAEAEKICEDFYQSMIKLEFVPAGRTIANVGNPLNPTVVSNCVVLHIEDSLEGIFQTLKDAAMLQQAGSGVGFPFHTLRPAGTITKRTLGTSSGPVSFMQIYNTCFGVVKQRGRHGANMAVFRVDHPDILEFIQAKDVEGELKNFNISVGLTDKFMKEVQEGLKLAPEKRKTWECTFNNQIYKPRRIIRDNNFNIQEIQELEVSAVDIWNLLIKQAWKNGEPGCVFLDTVNRVGNPLPGLGPIQACNPCGEQMLHNGDACNLGSINLALFVDPVTGKIDYERMRKTTRIAVRFLDNVIDLTNFPVERVNNMFHKNRRVGLGIMGLADMLMQLGVGYNTEEGRQIAAEVMKVIQEEGHAMSMELAKEKGVFENYPFSIYKEKNEPHRNAGITNVAPTGTTAMLCDVSSGIEPYFALAFHRANVLCDGSPNRGKSAKFSYVNKYLKAALEKAGIYSDELMDKIVQNGSLQNIPEIPESIKKVFVTSMDITPQDHIKMQGACQKYCDNAISKTINLPNSATLEDIAGALMFAWEAGCKGATVYRDGSRQIQVLNLNKKKEKKDLLGEQEGTDKSVHEEMIHKRPAKKPHKDHTGSTLVIEDHEGVSIEVEQPFHTTCKNGVCEL